MQILEKPTFAETDIETWTEEDYRRLLAEASGLMTAAAGDPRAARLSELADLLVAYERKHYPRSKPDPEARALYQRERRGEAVDWDSLDRPQ